MQLHSTHIRLLIFTPAEVVHCNVKIDDNEEIKCEQISENLFVVPWKPEFYKNGVHSLNVEVRTSDGKSKSV